MSDVNSVIKSETSINSPISSNINELHQTSGLQSSLTGSSSLSGDLTKTFSSIVEKYSTKAPSEKMLQKLENIVTTELVGHSKFLSEFSRFGQGISSSLNVIKQQR